MHRLLEVDGLQAWYGDLQVLRGVSFDIAAGEAVGVLGANGAGKTTLLRALSGEIRWDGAVRFQGKSLLGRSVDAIARMGLAHVPEGRRIFQSLSVRDNLIVALYPWQHRLGRGVVEDTLHKVHRLFPRLAERWRQRAGTLSGGEQQMLAIARALVQRPKLLMLDEPSQGLAPRLVAELMGSLQALRDEGVSILIVEQNVAVTVPLVDRVVALQQGRVAFTADAASIRDNRTLLEAYL